MMTYLQTFTFLNLLEARLMRPRNIKWVLKLNIVVNKANIQKITQISQSLNTTAFIYFETYCKDLHYI